MFTWTKTPSWRRLCNNTRQILKQIFLREHFRARGEDVAVRCHLLYIRR
jgi:hypothetical protein